MARLRALLLPCAFAAAVLGQSAPGLPDDADAGQHEPVADLVPDRAHLRLRLQSPAAAPSRLRLLQRLTAAGGNWRFAALVERDPGERRWHDHVNAYVHLWPRPSVEVVGGHLRPGFGQGLLFGRGSRTGVPAPRPRRDAEALGTHSAAEGRTILGVAARRRRGRHTVAVVVGALRWDARTDASGAAVSLPEDGDHTGTGAAARGRLHGTLVVGRWQARLGRASLGASLQHLRFARRLDLRRTDTAYAFHGRGQAAASLDAVLTRGRSRWFAAVARLGAHTAAVGGVTGAIGGGVRLDLLARRYGAGTFAPLGSAAGTMDNERGCTAQIRVRRLQGWLDAVRRPHGGWRQPLPVVRRGAGLRWEVRAGRRLRLQAEIQRRSASLWRSGTTGRDGTDRLRLQGRWTGSGVRVEGRVDGVRARARGGAGAAQVNSGQAGAVAIGWRGRHGSLDLQGSLFATDGYAARIYAAERALPGAVSIRPLYGRGGLGVLVLRAHAGPVALTLRWRAEVRDNQRRHQLGAQLDVGTAAR